MPTLTRLCFQNYKAKDSGTYVCNIKNDAGEANVELTLNIEGTFSCATAASLSCVLCESYAYVTLPLVRTF